MHPHKNLSSSALLEREHFPFPAHPRRAEINAALTGYKTLALAHAPATPAPPLPPPEAMGIERSPAMTLQSVSDALSSSNVSLLTPALRELARMADNNEVEDLEPCITQVSSKRILGHADFTVRAAAVAALSALVKSDEAATRAAMRKPPVFDQPSDSAGGGPEKHTARKNKEKEQEKKDMESQLYTEFISTQYYYYLEHMDHEPGAKPKRRRSTKESQGQADVPGAQVSVTTGAAAGALNDNGELGAGASASTEVAHTQVPDAPRPTPPAIAQQPIDTRLSVNSRLAGPVRGAGAGDEREAESATSGAGHVAGGKGEGLEAETQASMSAVELEKMKTVHFMMYQHIQLLQQHIREMQDHIQPEKQRKRHNNKSTLLTPAPLLTPGTACSGVGSTSIKNTAKRDSSAADGGGEREGGGYQGRSGVQADGGEAQKDNENGGGSGSAGKRADDGQAIGAGQPPQQRQVQDQRTVCRFGTECRNPKCKFTHPPGVGEVSWKQHEARIQGDPNWMVLPPLTPPLPFDPTHPPSFPASVLDSR